MVVSPTSPLKLSRLPVNESGINVVVGAVNDAASYLEVSENLNQSRYRSVALAKEVSAV